MMYRQTMFTVAVVAVLVAPVVARSDDLTDLKAAFEQGSKAANALDLDAFAVNMARANRQFWAALAVSCGREARAAEVFSDGLRQSGELYLHADQPPIPREWQHGRCVGELHVSAQAKRWSAGNLFWSLYRHLCEIRWTVAPDSQTLFIVAARKLDIMRNEGSGANAGARVCS